MHQYAGAIFEQRLPPPVRAATRPRAQELQADQIKARLIGRHINKALLNHIANLRQAHRIIALVMYR